MKPCASFTMSLTVLAGKPPDPSTGTYLRREPLLHVRPHRAGGVAAHQHRVAEAFDAFVRLDARDDVRGRLVEGGRGWRVGHHERGNADGGDLHRVSSLFVYRPRPP